MNIHEYQAKQLLKGYGVDVLDGGVVYSEVDAFTVAERLGGPIWVVKSQIHAGGRGKGKFKEEASKILIDNGFKRITNMRYGIADRNNFV